MNKKPGFGESSSNDLGELYKQVAALEQRQRILANVLAGFLRSHPQGPDPSLFDFKETADFVTFIVGGVQISLEDFDSCADCRNTIPEKFSCCGVLIGPRLLATAAHCGPKGFSTSPNQAVFHITDEKDLSGAEMIGVKFHDHEKFTGEGAFDIAVLKLASSPQKATPVPIASSAELAAATHVTLVGFGKDEFGKRGKKLKAKVPIQYMKGGVGTSPTGLNFDPNSEFVAGMSGAGGCFGDSGGGAYVQVGDKFKLAGIISRPPTGQTPACGGITIVTRADFHRNWLAQFGELA